MSSVRQERSNWRDENYSAWHRQLGYDVPWQDIDSLVFEYDAYKPVALIELKNEHAALLKWDAPQAKAARNLADGYRDDAGNPLPFFVVYYKTDLSKFVVHPYNLRAHQLIQTTRSLTAGEYCQFLYWLRGKSTPADVLENAERAALRFQTASLN